MNGFTEPLPGLLDDPQFQLVNLPTLSDFYIAPLRDPAPSRHSNIPLPLEPLAKYSLEDKHHSTKTILYGNNDLEKSHSSAITQSDLTLARELTKQHLAISELLDADQGTDHIPAQLPSFVSLSVVERSPIPGISYLNNFISYKRPRLDNKLDGSSHDRKRMLPRPPQKDDKQPRPVPLLPAMVTGLHEPPPSAALLPSIDLDVRPALTRSTSSKMHVRDILTESSHSSGGRPPESMLNTPETVTIKLLSSPTMETVAPADANTQIPISMTYVYPQPQKKDPKVRRARRRWTKQETNDLLAGVAKHGFGKWKQILTDPDHNFVNRTATDLKDRYRIFAKDITDLPDQQQPSTPQDYSSQASGEDGTPLPAGHSLTPSQSTPSYHSNHSTSKTRRKRNPWSAAEDEALLRGVSQHGFQWTAIHDDPYLELSHRRATDLRDRIRNLFPDGYKHAEARPLRSELKKAEKTNGATAAGALESSPMQRNASTDDNGAVPLKSADNVDDEERDTPCEASSKDAQGKIPSIAAITLSNDDVAAKNVSKRAKTAVNDTQVQQQQMQSGVTLPSLDLDDGDMDWNNTLPPLIDWDDFGM